MRALIVVGCMTACASSCTTAVREVQSVGEAIVDAKSFKAAETIVAPLHSDLELKGERIDRLERRIQKLERKVRHLLQHQHKPRYPKKRKKVNWH